jgi:hypothetical protein
MKTVFIGALGLVACSAPNTRISNTPSATSASSPVIQSATPASSASTAATIAASAPASMIVTTPGCSALHAHWRQEMFSDEMSPQDEVEFTALIQKFPCSLQLDLDGDKRPDEVSIHGDKTKIGLAIKWGNGKSEVLGAGKKIKLGPDDEPISDFDWLFNWSVAPNQRGSFSVNVLRKAHLFEAKDALGDGISLNGGDASAILYLSKKGWRLLELGF